MKSLLRSLCRQLFCGSSPSESPQSTNMLTFDTACMINGEFFLKDGILIVLESREYDGIERPQEYIKSRLLFLSLRHALSSATLINLLFLSKYMFPPICSMIALSQLLRLYMEFCI